MRTRLLAMASTALLAIALAACTATPPTSTDTATVSAAPATVKTLSPAATATPAPSAAPTGCDLSGWVQEVQYYSPLEAPGGFQQIPYQETLENMGVATDAGDVAAVQRMWTETLSGMFYNEQLVEDIQKHVDAGDPEVLRQLFS